MVFLHMSCTVQTLPMPTALQLLRLQQQLP